MSALPSGMRLLNSWKEIASYLGRGVRTVQRWQSIGLPVRRLGNGPRAPVVADARDLDRWVLGAANIHGIRTPQSTAHLVFRGQLADSVEQARGLRDQMLELREASNLTVLRLTQTLAAMHKACISSHVDGSGKIKGRSRPRGGANGRRN